jgi:hypothetical protein
MCGHCDIKDKKIKELEEDHYTDRLKRQRRDK